jgi:hypothetical protein
MSRAGPPFMPTAQVRSIHGLDRDEREAERLEPGDQSVQRAVYL